MKSNTFLSKLSPEFVGLLQAVSLFTYCGLVGLVFWNGQSWFGQPTLLGPIIFLLLFVLSAIVSAALVFGYPLLIFWEEKKIKKPIQIVFDTTLWLAFFFLLSIFLLLWR